MSDALFAVVSPPRSGTQWYSRLFSDGEVHCFHELTTLMQPWPAKAVYREAFVAEISSVPFEQQQRRFFLDAYPRYVSRHLERVERGARWVGNSDNSLVSFAVGLWLVWPATRFLFSVRNGINQVNSAHVYEAKLPALVRATRTAQLAALEPFGAACRRWVSVIESLTSRRTWLEAAGAPCLSTTLEAVTGDVGELERVWRFVAGNWEQHAERAVSLMQRPANQWVNLSGAVYRPDEIWASWSTLEREQFAEICGPTQESLGYELPPVGP